MSTVVIVVIVFVLLLVFVSIKSLKSTGDILKKMFTETDTEDESNFYLDSINAKKIEDEQRAKLENENNEKFEIDSDNEKVEGENLEKLND
ncbi:MAG: hypothetical protein RR052_00915, partial [Oscillospiraceae bacterium]